MIKKFVLVASIVFSNVATAGTASVPPPVIPVSSIITPNVATGYITIDYVFVDDAGNMGGCQSTVLKDGPTFLAAKIRVCEDPLRPFKDFVPAGKQYVGFTPWMNGRVIIFWK